MYGRFDSKIRFEIESDGRFDSRFDSNAKKNDSQVPTYLDTLPQHITLMSSSPVFRASSSSHYRSEKCPHSDTSQLGDFTTQSTSIVKVFFQVNLGQPVPSRISSYVCSRKEHLRINGKDCFYSPDVLLVSQPTVSKH